MRSQSTYFSTDVIKYEIRLMKLNKNAYEDFLF